MPAGVSNLLTISALLERELDVEALFKEDLAGLKPEQIRCLKYVAERAPAYVSEVEDLFNADLTNSLLSKRLLVRSGLNYVIYWDIFRDYLTQDEPLKSPGPEPSNVTRGRLCARFSLSPWMALRRRGDFQRRLVDLNEVGLTS